MSKPMSEQMQKLAARYEKATGKKFNDSMAHRAKYWLHWLQRPAEEEPK